MNPIVPIMKTGGTIALGSPERRYIKILRKINPKPMAPKPPTRLFV
jgi:hypothetical protein